MKSAIVGCGNIAQVHAKSINWLEGATFTAVADCELPKAEKMAETFGARAYGSLEEMLEKEQIDVLHICTPHYLHTPMAVAALQRGINVFMEKPPVISWRQWEDLKQAVTQAKGRAELGICFQNRFNASVQYVKKQLEQGSYGRILGVRGMVTWHRDEDYYKKSSWRGRLETEGGGALINQSIHTLDLMQYLIGQKPVSMNSVIDNQHLPGKIEVEDTMAAFITYPQAQACFYAATSYAADVPPLLELECERARVRIEDLNVTVWERGEDGQMGKEKKELLFPEQERLGKSYWGGGHLYCIRSFYESLEKGTRFPLNLDALEDTIWLLLSAYKRIPS